MNKTLPFITLILLAGCAATQSRQNFNTLQLGMTKQEVQAQLGQPDSMNMDNGKDCMVYSIWRDFWNRAPGDYSDRYYTCFKNNKLSSFGRIGDDI